MSILVIQSRSGPDGKLHLEIPVEQPDTESEVQVVVRPKGTGSPEWPPGYLDLFGSVEDETFVRPPQGELPPPAELE